MTAASPHPENDLSRPLMADLLVANQEDDVQAREVLNAARSLRSALRDDQDAADVRGTYSAAIHIDMLAARLFDITTPRKFGGLQLPLPVLTSAVMEISRGNPGSGWCYALAAGHTITLAAHWPEAVQREVFAAGTFLAPHQFAWTGEVRAVEGGFVIDGTYGFCSGAPYSTHMIITSPIADGTQVTLLIPRTGYEVLDDWHGAFGMKASGSNSVRFERQFVPNAWALTGIGDDMTETPIGVELHGDGMYAGRLNAYHFTGLAAVAVGTARAALDEFVELISSSRSKNIAGASKAEDLLYQQTLGLAASKVDAAETLTLAASVAYVRASRNDADGVRKFTAADVGRFGAPAGAAVQLANEAIDLLFEHAGTLNIADGTRMQRYFRDSSMQRTHGRSHPRTNAVRAGVAYLDAEPH